MLRVETTSPVDGEAVSRAAPSGLMMPYVRCTPYSQHSRLRVRPGPNDCLVPDSNGTPAASGRRQTLPTGHWQDSESTYLQTPLFSPSVA